MYKSKQPPPFWVFRKSKSLKKLREEDKEDKKKSKSKQSKAKPFINEKNKILLPTTHNLGESIRQSNRTKILLDLEFVP